VPVHHQPRSYPPKVLVHNMKGMPTRAVNGDDLVVYLESLDAIPKTFVMKQRMNDVDLKAEFGESATVFLANKNLQSYPKGMRGSLIWVPFLAVIATMIYSTGVEAVVSVLYPTSKKGKKSIIDLTELSGQYLNYVTGPNPNALCHSEFRPRQDDVMLTDRNGCIKMSIEGGDVGIPEAGANSLMLDDGDVMYNVLLEPGAGAVPHKVKNVLKRNPLSIDLKTRKLPPKNSKPSSCHTQTPQEPQPPKSHKRKRGGRKRRKGAPSVLNPYPIDVVYVYSHDPEKYSHVETYLDDWSGSDIDQYLDDNTLPSGKMRRVPVFSVPVGEPFGDPHDKISPPTSKRYDC
jgi:hypothetical protein